MSHPTLVPPVLDPVILRRDFPILGQTINGRTLAYLDNAATTQKPAPVLAALEAYYLQDNANVHRGFTSSPGVPPSRTKTLVPASVASSAQRTRRR